MLSPFVSTGSRHGADFGADAPADFLDLSLIASSITLELRWLGDEGEVDRVGGSENPPTHILSILLSGSLAPHRSWLNFIVVPLGSRSPGGDRNGRHTEVSLTEFGLDVFGFIDPSGC